MMNTDIISILKGILDIIAYQDDKDVFISEFLHMCLQKSFADYAELLPDERKKELQQHLQSGDPVKIRELMEPYATTEEFLNILQANTGKYLQDYFETILPTLSQEQKKNLNSYIMSLNPANR